MPDDRGLILPSRCRDMLLLYRAELVGSMAPTGGAGGEGAGVAPASSLSSPPAEQQPPLGERSRRTSSKTKLEVVAPEPTLDALASALEDGNSKSDGEW